MRISDWSSDVCSSDLRDQIDHELRLIDQLAYAPYFLTVNSIVAESRRRGILCQGRGSAANSCVCYLLGITSIDPIKHELLFERFVSGERKRSEEHTSELQSLMRISYAVFCLKKN